MSEVPSVVQPGFLQQRVEPRVGPHRVELRIDLPEADTIGMLRLGPRQSGRWLVEEIRKQNYDLLIVSGYARRACNLALPIARLFRTPIAMRLDSVMFEKPPVAKRKRA